MKQDLRLLDQVQVAKPCPANWDEMKGDDQVRHCTHCRLNVYNLSEMDAEAALTLVRNAEGRMCVRLYRRDDGTIITRDCPKGLRAFRQRAVKRLALAASFVLSAVGCGQTAERLKADFGYTPPDPISTVTVTAGVMAYPSVPPPTKAPAKSTPTKKPKAKAKK